MHVEVCAFDAHVVRNPGVHGKAYQEGPLFRANLRGAVLARDGGQCLYCGAREHLTIDHVVAKRHGGSDALWNRVPACRACNEAKDDSALDVWLQHEPRPSVRQRAARTLGYVERVRRGQVGLKSMAAANVVAPAIADALETLGHQVVRTTGADTAHWRSVQGLEKSHAADAVCTAAKSSLVAARCECPLRVQMTGRGRRLVVKVNASGFPRLKNDGSPATGHRECPPCGLRAGDTVRIGKKGFGQRRRIGIATTVRNDGRCVVTSAGKKFNVMANALTLAHRGLGARIS